MNVIPKSLLDLPLFLALGMSLAVPLIMLNVKFAKKLGLIDWPKARGMAQDQVPIIGASLVLVSLIYFGYLASTNQVSGFFILGIVIIAVMGYIDDLRARPASDKMLIQLFAVVCVVLFDPMIRQAVTERYGAWGTFWGIFFILGLMNAINFIDGIDGLAGIVLGMGSFGFVLFSYDHAPSAMLTTYSMILMGMMIPFLYFNVAKRKGFLGNIGSYTLSYIIAIQHLSVPMESPHIISRLALPGLCFLVPIADASMVLLSRLSTRRSPFQADKGHLHHRLMQTALPLRYILAVFSMIAFLGVLTATLLKSSQTELVSWVTIFTCISHITMVGLLIVLVEKASKRRMQGYLSHLDKGESIFFIKYRLTQEDGTPAPLHVLHRLEARINAEIRVTDLCYAEEPNLLFVTLRNLTEPYKGVSARFDAIFEQERVKTSRFVEEGEILKVARAQATAQGRISISN